MLLNRPEFIAFKERQKAEGFWGEWTCTIQPGVITFSRDIQLAQRAMNANQNAPFGVPVVPETGRHNVEMLEYNHLVLDAAIGIGRAEYRIAFVLQLLSLLREEAPAAVSRDNAKEILAALTPKAKAKRLARTFEKCGKPVDNVYDSVACRMVERDASLKKAEERFEAYKDRLNGLRGPNVVTPETLADLGEDAAQIDGLLRKAKQEGDASVGTAAVE